MSQIKRKEQNTLNFKVLFVDNLSLVHTKFFVNILVHKIQFVDTLFRLFDTLSLVHTIFFVDTLSLVHKIFFVDTLSLVRVK